MEWQEIVINNKFVGMWATRNVYLTAKMRKYQDFIIQGAVDLSKIPHDKNHNCCKNFPNRIGRKVVCEKIVYEPKTLQRYFSKSKIDKNNINPIINTKPKVGR